MHLQPADGTVEHHELEQKPAVLHEWVAQLQRRFAGGQIAVALEQRKGAVIHALLMYNCFILYPINPKALARYREAFTTSGAKDDPRDSELLLDLVVRHRDQLQHQRAQTTRFLEAVNRGDVGMIQRSEELRFTLEACDAFGVGGEEFGQNLDRDVTAQLRVARAVDLTL